MDVELDASGLRCPLPLLKARQTLNGMASGDCLLVRATDPGSVRDFRVYVQHSGHEMLEFSEHDGVYSYRIRKR